MDSFKKQLLYTLAQYGARRAKISNKQKMKLEKWILPYLMDELGGSRAGPIDIKEIRKFIDSWESDDLNEEDYKYYYVDKSGKGNSLWDLI